MASVAERRRSGRVNIERPCVVIVGTSLQPRRAQLLNLSREGALLRSDAPFPPGASIKLQLTDVSMNAVQARVVRSVAQPGNGYYVGIELNASNWPEELLYQGDTIVDDPEVPLDVADFAPEAEIGIGGMGRVYRAYQISKKRKVAIKRINQFGDSVLETLSRFEAEGKSSRQLRHPNIVCCFGIGRCHDGTYFLAMELVDGGDLHQMIKPGGLPISEVIRIAIIVADALEHAHSKGVIHCDLKPGNILLGRDGTVKVTDFGIARWLGGAQVYRSDPRGICGTPQFMAPEQVDADRWGDITPATDIFALGGLMYCMLTGKPPVNGRDITDILARVAAPHLNPAPLRSQRRDVPPELEAICNICLTKNPQARYSSCRQVADALRAINLSDHPQRTGLPPLPPLRKSSSGT